MLNLEGKSTNVGSHAANCIHSRIKLSIKTFLNRLINDWNTLPVVVVNVNSVNNFKSLLDDYSIHFYIMHYCVLENHFRRGGPF